MGRPQNSWVHAQFKNIVKPHLKTSRRQCLHCGYETKFDVTRQEHHLKQCVLYQQSVAQKRASIPLQTSISLKTTSFQKKDVLDRKFALAVYEGGLPFSVFEASKKPAMSEAFNALDPSYTPPSARLLGGRLLEEMYNTKKEEVCQRISAARYLNFTTDESESIRGDRIANLSLNLVQGGTFHLSSLNTGSKTHTSENLAAIALDELQKWTENRMNCINSINTDTCNTMRRMHEILQEQPELKHVFFTLCDSHGLQLLIKDILKLPWYSDVVKSISKIVATFKKSPLQMAILREHQMVVYGKHKAFILRYVK
jgi:hypothetical protein